MLGGGGGALGRNTHSTAIETDVEEEARSNRKEVHTERLPAAAGSQDRCSEFISTAF